MWGVDPVSSLPSDPMSQAIAMSPGQADRVELGFLSEACVDFQDAINSWGRKAQGNVVWDVDQSW